MSTFTLAFLNKAAHYVRLCTQELRCGFAHVAGWCRAERELVVQGSPSQELMPVISFLSFFYRSSSQQLMALKVLFVHHGYSTVCARFIPRPPHCTTNKHQTLGVCTLLSIRLCLSKPVTTSSSCSASRTFGSSWRTSWRSLLADR